MVGPKEGMGQSTGNFNGQLRAEGKVGSGAGP